MITTETHPMPQGFVPENTRCLIMGTFPPQEYVNMEHFFFYPSPQNHFWNRMENIFPEFHLKKTKGKLQEVSEEKNVRDKKEFSKQKRIGFLDIFTKISRRDGTNDDTNLENIADVVSNGKLLEILEANPSIQRICCTYSLAFKTLKSGLAETKSCEISDIGETQFQVKLSGSRRTIDVFLLYPATRSRHRGLDKDRQYAALVFWEER
jgi:G:T/U-mismatch repair DNA glycosylase